MIIGIYRHFGKFVNYFTKPIKIVKCKKLSKKFIVWNGINIKELAVSMNMDVPDVIEAICLVTKSDQKLKYSTEITDMEILKKVAKLCGGVIEEKNLNLNISDELKDKKDLYRRNIYQNYDRLKPRPPVVTIMGHVDHGKTTLLDSLRSSRIVDSEFGGITQHLRAFKVSTAEISQNTEIPSNNHFVTFLDTPGHAAFSAMRSRGANCTDIIVLVVAVEDGIMPQTIESIGFAQEAKVPIIVAVNKIDKIWNNIKHFQNDSKKAQLEPIKRNLSKYNLFVEDYGGDVQLVPISAQKKWNLDLLQESILALAEILNIRADYEGTVEAIILEANKIDNVGKVATVLVQHGCLKPGQTFVCGNTSAVIRTITSDRGDLITEAKPGDPVQISGWKDDLPLAGDVMIQVESKARLKEVLAHRKKKADLIRSNKDYIEYERNMVDYKMKYHEYMETGYRTGVRLKKDRPILPETTSSNKIVNGVEIPSVSIIIKTDVQGSLEAIMDTLNYAVKSCENQCSIKIISSDVGNLTPTDIELACTFKAVIYLFNLPKNLPDNDESELNIRCFNVIYHLFDDLKELIEQQLPSYSEMELSGEGEVLKIFEISEKKKTVSACGSKCTNGALYRSPDYVYRIVQRNKYTNELEIINDNLICIKLTHFKVPVDIIRKGTEFIIVFEDKLTGKIISADPGNIFQCFKVIWKRPKAHWNLGFSEKIASLE